METVEKAVDALTSAFEEFKATNESRLKSLEKKGRADPLVEEKLERINRELDTLSEQLQKTELKGRRPGLEVSFEDRDYKHAFNAYLRKGEESRLIQLESKSLSAGVDTDGGFLIPQVLSTRLKEELEGLSPIRSLANVVTISGSSLDLLVDKDSAEVGWAAEADERPETKTPNLAKIKIPVHELYAKIRATQKLLEDACINVEEWLAERISTQMARAENKAFLFGDGAKKPSGILSCETVETGHSEWGKLEEIKTGVNGGLNADNPADAFIDTLNALKAEYQKGAVWMMSRTAQGTLRKLKDKNGQYLWQPGLGAEVLPTLMGYRVFVCEDMPALVSGHASKSVLFANFKEGYQIVDRTDARVLRDPYSAKPYVEFYTTKRVGGAISKFDAIKVINFSD